MSTLDEITKERAPAHDNCKSRWRQAQFVEPRRPGPGSGNRQDAAGNRCCMQGRSPQPCRAALSRHKRAGRIEERDGKLYAIQSTSTEQQAAL